MFPNSEGKRVPQVTFRTREAGQWKNVTTDDIFKGRTVVAFSLPGAYTPTCSSSHLPRYNELVPTFRKNGVDDVVVISVNDGFVMSEWQNDQDAPNVTFIPDGNGDFTAGMGLLVDKSDLGFGKRSWRYSMLVKDGVVQKMFIEPDKEGDPFEVSDADTMLAYIAPREKAPEPVVIFAKAGCPHCARAKSLLAEKGLVYEEVTLGKGITSSTLRAVSGKGTTPQVFIGAGTAGLAAYRAARAAGARTVLIEGGPYGTTCARVGCMPSKLIIAAAEAAHGIGRAHGFGVHVDHAARIDGREVMARVKRERDRFVGFVLKGVDAIPESDRIVGHARFVDRQTLYVAGKRIEARSIVIATGSRPSVPPILRDLGDRLVVNDDVFSWDDLPRSVAVFGPGVIGLELGQALSRLGVRVVVLGRGGRLGPITDPYVHRAAVEAFTHEFHLDPDAHVSRVERVGDQVEIEYVDRGEKRTERFDYVLAATGRIPNVDALGLEALGLERDARGVPLFDRTTLQIADTSIFMAGDAADDVPLLHEAADEGRIAGANAAAFPDVAPHLRRAPLGIVFTDPQIAIVGPGFSALKTNELAAGEVSFDDQGRSRVMLRNKGLLRVYGDPSSGRFLGAEMAGPDAEHIGHLLAWALQSRMTVAQMLEMPFYHPVVEEGLRTALRELDAHIRQSQPLAA